MAVTVSFNGTNYSIPENKETGWGTSVREWIQAVSSGALSKAGGSFTLTGEVDFGATHGLKAAYYKSRNSNVAASGQVRLGNSETINFRNAANDGDISISATGAEYLSGVTGGSIQSQLDAKIAKSVGTTAGDIIYFTGSAAPARLGIGTAGRILKVNSGATAPEWADASGSNYTAVTGTYNVLTTDSSVSASASGGALTLNLFTAVGNSGKRLTLTKTDTSFNAVTVEPDGGETVGGAANTTLNTRGESLSIVSDGANWIVESRSIPSVWTSFTPTGNWTTNCTYTGFWRRVGDTIEINAKVAVSGAPGTPGSTIFSIVLPGSQTIDTAKLVQADTTMPFPGGGNIWDNDTSAQYPVAGGCYVSSTSVGVTIMDDAAAGVIGGPLTTSSTITFAANDYVVVNVSGITVSGWNG